MNIFFIPGLGYDCQIFGGLDLEDLSWKCLPWIEPEKDESIEAYSNRLFAGVEKKEGKTVLIGHSFGGMVSQQIAANHQVDKIILLSSIKSRKEMPLLFKMAKSFLLHRLFTKELSIQTVKYWGKNHGFESQEEQGLFKNMLSKQSNTYLQWALKSLSAWTPPQLPPATQLVHIHGTRDKTFPFKLIEKPDFVIQGGSHIMAYKQPAPISEFLIREIKKA